MGSFLENIIKNVDLGSLLGTASEKVEDGSLDDILEKVGINSEGKLGNLGGLATGVINVINIAKNMFGKGTAVTDEEDAEEESEETDDFDDVE